MTGGCQAVGGRIAAALVRFVIMTGACGAWQTATAQDPQPADAEQSALADTPLDIVAFDISGNSLLDQRSIERAVYPSLGPGRTLSDVEKARAALEAGYRERGYETVVVDIPRQDGTDGIIELRVVEAPVGKIEVVGNRYVSDAAIRRGVPSLAAGKAPDLNKVQAEIAQLNRVSDRPVTPLLKPGAVPGTVDVELSVEDKRPLHGSLELSNDHNADTEPLRLGATIRYADLWERGHSASATYIVAPENRDNSEVISLNYIAPLLGTPWTVMAFGYKSNSRIASLGGTNVLGNGYSIGLRGILQLPPAGSFGQSITFGLNYNDFEETIEFGGELLEAPIRYVPFTIAYSATLAGERSSSSATLALTGGLRGAGSNEDEFRARGFSTGSFVHLNLDFEHLMRLGGDVELLLRLSGQLADNHLVSGEQFAAGGLQTVRGYLQSAVVGDDGYFSSAELRSPQLGPLLGDWLDARLFTFVDAAKTHTQRAGLEQQADFALLSVGLGARLRLFDLLTGLVAVGVPLVGTSEQTGDPRTTFSVKAEF